jgi:hypothetical protein
MARDKRTISNVHRMSRKERLLPPCCAENVIVAAMEREKVYISTPEMYVGCTLRSL